MSVNAPYLGLIERECDRRSEEREMQEYRKKEQRRNLVYSGVFGIVGIIIGYLLSKFG